MEIITLNMVPKGITPVCHASQFDDGRVIRLNIVDELHGYIFTDEDVELRVRKPDDNVVTASVEVVSGNAYVDIVTTEQMTACKGDNKCELRITKGDTNIGTLNFIMRCEEDPLAEGIESETEIHNLETQVADLVSVEVAAQYDSSNVIFDDTPTENHGIGHAVTSEGIKRAIDNVNPDASAVNYDNTDSGLTATNVQDAVDEVNDKADSNATQIGSLSQLTTTEKSSLVGAVNEVNGDLANYFNKVGFKNLTSQTPITSTTTLTYTGVYINIPAKSFYSLSASALYQNNSPTQIVITTSNSRNDLVPYASSNNGVHKTATISGYTENAVTFYIWAQYSAVGTNPIQINGFAQTVPS